MIQRTFLILHNNITKRQKAFCFVKMTAFHSFFFLTVNVLYSCPEVIL